MKQTFSKSAAKCVKSRKASRRGGKGDVSASSRQSPIDKQVNEIKKLKSEQSACTDKAPRGPTGSPTCSGVRWAALLQRVGSQRVSPSRLGPSTAEVRKVLGLRGPGRLELVERAAAWFDHREAHFRSGAWRLQREGNAGAFLWCRALLSLAANHYPHAQGAGHVEPPPPNTEVCCCAV